MYSGLMKPGTYSMKTWQGLNIHARNYTDLTVLDEVFIKRAYDQEPRRIPLGGVVVDVGAHIGSFSLYAVSKRKARRVVSYEPCPDNFEMLKMNVESNNLNEVISPVPKAVAGKHEFRTLYLSEFSGSHSLFSGVGKAIQVECVTLKEVLDDNGIDHVDFLKLDCEGAEYEILQTIDESTLNRINMVGMEFHGHPREWFVSKLQELGFSVSQQKEDWRSRVYIIASK